MRNIQWISFCMCGSVSACASGVFSCIEHRLRTNAYLLKLKLSTNSLTFCFYCLWNTNKNKQKTKTKVSTFWQIPFFHFPFTYAYSTPETRDSGSLPRSYSEETWVQFPIHCRPLLAFCHNNWECAFIHLHIPHIHTYVCIYRRMCAWMFPVFLYAQIQYFLPSVKKKTRAYNLFRLLFMFVLYAFSALARSLSVYCVCAWVCVLFV